MQGAVFQLYNIFFLPFVFILFIKWQRKKESKFSRVSSGTFRSHQVCAGGTYAAAYTKWNIFDFCSTLFRSLCRCDVPIYVMESARALENGSLTLHVCECECEQFEKHLKWANVRAPHSHILHKTNAPSNDTTKSVVCQHSALGCAFVGPISESRNCRGRDVDTEKRTHTMYVFTPAFCVDNNCAPSSNVCARAHVYSVCTRYSVPLCALCVLENTSMAANVHRSKWMK